MINTISHQRSGTWLTVHTLKENFDNECVDYFMKYTKDVMKKLGYKE